LVSGIRALETTLTIQSNTTVTEGVIVTGTDTFSHTESRHTPAEWSFIRGNCFGKSKLYGTRTRWDLRVHCPAVETWMASECWKHRRDTVL